jgi:NDP-sugar pyrophosphorylase family protein
LDRVIIGEKAEVLDSIIGRHTTILSSGRKPTKVNAVSVVADDVTVEEGCSLTATKIYPHQSVRGEFQNQILMPAMP